MREYNDPFDVSTVSCFHNANGLVTVISSAVMGGLISTNNPMLVILISNNFLIENTLEFGREKFSSHPIFETISLLP